MNERIQELITAYLHRGSTPEQERELFEACSRQPETAELLRSHLILSLKLRTLRDDTYAPTDVRNEVLRRINVLESEALQQEETQKAKRRERTPHAGFGWAKFTATAAATAALVSALFLLYPDNEDSTLTPLPIAQLPDTVYIVTKDTVTQIREIERPATIVRTVPATRLQDEDTARDDFAPHSNPRTVATGGMANQHENNTVTEADIPGHPATDADMAHVSETDPVDEEHPVATDMPEEERPTLAGTADTLPRAEKTQTYIEQYNSMLVSVESVQISSKDRIH
ncbi:MAG: hypothetical protein KFH87_04450 [Bacteroidetes bacterium]|nr:hypothetical protein [Bacteroidota bacterium]